MLTRKKWFWADYHCYGPFLLPTTKGTIASLQPETVAKRNSRVPWSSRNLLKLDFSSLLFSSVLLFAAAWNCFCNTVSFIITFSTRMFQFLPFCRFGLSFYFMIYGVAFHSFLFSNLFRDVIRLNTGVDRTALAKVESRSWSKRHHKIKLVS